MARSHRSSVKRGLALLTALAAAALPIAVTSTADAAVSPDRPVSVDSHYVKANGRTPSAGDAITACGTNRRQQNEPTAAVDPSPATETSSPPDPTTTARSSSPAAPGPASTAPPTAGAPGPTPCCPATHRHVAGGSGQPAAAAGIANAGDPVQAWDLQGRLFYMGNAFNRGLPQNGAVWVATYDQDAAHYVRTVIVGHGRRRAQRQVQRQDLDRGRPRRQQPVQGNVYVAWSLFQGNGNNEIKFVRSTDHGATFSQPAKISDRLQGQPVRRHRGDQQRHRLRRLERHRRKSSRGRPATRCCTSRSTDGGRTFTKPRRRPRSSTASTPPTPPATPRQPRRRTSRPSRTPTAPSPRPSEESVGDSRDCGSGPFACQSGFVFFRHDSQPRITADPKADRPARVPGL